MTHTLLIDSISLLSNLTGIGRYTYEISKRLSTYDTLDISYYYGYHSKKLITPSSSTQIKTLKTAISAYPILKKIARKILNHTSNLFAPTYDIYWQPNFIPLSNIKAHKIITTVHDFSFILHKQYHPKERIDYFNKYFFTNIKKSDIIITGSEFSKQEILQRLPFKSDQVKVIYHGINHDIFKVYKNLDDSLKNLNLPEHFIFSVGSIEPRKNLLGLLKAYNNLNPDLKNKYKLVLAGFKGWQNDEIMSLINKNRSHIKYLGFLSDLELAYVYNKASCFVFASFYEGFGLPLIESMACGTPVISSDQTSMPEICLDSALYCNPYDINDIKSKIQTLLQDKQLQNTLTQKGLKRAQNFTWELSANKHLELFFT